MLPFDLIQEFVVDLLRTLVIEELCQRVQRQREGFLGRRRRRKLSRRAVHRLSAGRRTER
jgi:hypothetical protein